ncbi:MAG: hypothetical protein HRT88_00060 [Lentisphaeraceae bacterium]|nr:hypothetical protein [Lentisphaeraceae bacterium]
MSDFNPTTGEASALMFCAWRDSVSDTDLTDIQYRGGLNRSEIAKACGFAKSVLKQNPQVKILLAEFEDELSSRGILSPKTKNAEAAESRPKNFNSTAKSSAAKNRRIVELEQRVVELEAKLRRLESLDEAVQWAVRHD